MLLPFQSSMLAPVVVSKKLTVKGRIRLFGSLESQTSGRLVLVLKVDQTEAASSLLGARYKCLDPA